MTRAAAPPAGAAGARLSAMEYVRSWWSGVRRGQLGSLPTVVGLVIIAAIFGSLDPVFFTDRNFVNLLLQMAGTATIAIGVVFVLLVGEIDLSVAYVSGVGGVVVALLLRPGDPGWAWPLALGTALLITVAIGAFHGIIVTRAGIPSFVVTLAGLLIWSGVVLILTTQLSTAGNVLIQDRVILGIANSFLSPTWGWALGVAAVAGYAARQVFAVVRQRDIAGTPIIIRVLQTALVAAGTAFAIWHANGDRGVPMAFIILLGFLGVWSVVAGRTRFGRHVYAVGGNAEAARRAGIRVDRIKLAVFMISGFMAGAGGIMLASRLRSVSTNTGGGNLLLNVIAAAVIGGTSLFGGKGRVSSAFLGAAVIAAVDSGMDLLGLASGAKFVITGLVLLAAVFVDALAKRGRAAAGAA